MNEQELNLILRLKQIRESLETPVMEYTWAVDDAFDNIPFEKLVEHRKILDKLFEVQIAADKFLNISTFEFRKNKN